MKEINTEQTFKQIKKQNGEAVAKILRSEILLDIPNIIHIMEFAGNNSDNIKLLVPIIREIYKNTNTVEYQTDKNPIDLLKEAGYDAFVVTNETEKNSIKKYYRPNEEICTFRDPVRHKNYYIIHAVKYDANRIKPANHPERDDKYGTSVISIQIAKTGGFISIKNRYNHTVNNPDATFNNNPDNIIHGLSSSLKKYFNVDFNVSKSMIPDNFHIVNDQFIYFNYEIENTYFGPNYYFSGSSITKINSNYEFMLDYFILNTKTSELKDVTGIKDTTYKILQNIFQNKKISIQINPNNKYEHLIYTNGVHVLSEEKGVITELNLTNLKCIGDNFLKYNKFLRKFYAPNLESIDNDFLVANNQLTEIDLPVLKIVGHNFLSYNSTITDFNTPFLEKIGSGFLMQNQILKNLDLPSLKELGDYCLKDNIALSKFYAPQLEIIGHLFLFNNKYLTEMNLPSVRKIGDGFLRNNKTLKHLNAPKLEKIGDHVMLNNLDLTELKLPSLIEIGYNFLSQNKNLKVFYAPKLKITKWNLLSQNTELKDFIVANNTMCYKYNKRLKMILAKNKIKNKVKNTISNIINIFNYKHDNNKT